MLIHLEQTIIEVSIIKFPSIVAARFFLLILNYSRNSKARFEVDNLSGLTTICEGITLRLPTNQNVMIRKTSNNDDSDLSKFPISIPRLFLPSLSIFLSNSRSENLNRRCCVSKQPSSVIKCCRFYLPQL